MKRSIPKLPGSFDPDAMVWARAVNDAVLALPYLSIISTTDGPNTSGATGALGELAIDVGSSATRLWQKYSASTSTTGWQGIV